MATFAVVVTGGIASGKSAVTSRFEKLGITVVDADIAARDVVAIGTDGLGEVIARFGADVLTDDGSMDRAKLRQIIYADPSARKDLEAIIHPRVRDYMISRCLQATSPYVLAAIPLFTEVGARQAYPWIDRVLVIDVAPETQLARLMRRDDATEELAQKMIAAQATRAQRLAVADDILSNEGTLESLDGPIASLDRLYRKLASAENSA